MVTKHDLEYVGHESMADYYEAIAQHIEQNNLSTSNDMKSVTHNTKNLKT